MMIRRLVWASYGSRERVGRDKVSEKKRKKKGVVLYSKDVHINISQRCIGEKGCII